MSTNEEKAIKFLSYAGGSAAVIGTLALVIAAVFNARTILSGAVLLIFQVLFVVLAICFSYYLMWQLRSRLLAEIAELEGRYGEELSRLRRRTPTLVATILLTADAVMLIADKSFGGDAASTIAVSFVLLIVFWVANELLASNTHWRRILGVFVWLFGVLYLPLAILAYHRWDLISVITFISGFDAITQVFFGLMVVLFLILPATVRWATDAA